LGQIVFSEGNLLVYSDVGADDCNPGEWTELTFEMASGDDSYVTYFDRFADAVFEGRSPDIPGEEGRKDLEVFLAAYRSGETSTPVTLPLEV
jgi:predicted dehydrogenase